jgi:hypothetical protein
MSIFVVIEAVLILVVVVAVWQRVRPADPPFGAPMGWVGLALLGQGLLLFLADIVVHWIGDDAPVSRVTTAAWAVWGIQLARAVLFVLAVAMWLRIVKPRLQRSWRGIVLTIALLVITLLPDVPVIGSLLVIIVLFRLQWTNQVYGWRRFFGFFAALVLFVLTLVKIVLGLATRARWFFSAVTFQNRPRPCRASHPRSTPWSAPRAHYFVGNC